MNGCQICDVMLHASTSMLGAPRWVPGRQPGPEADGRGRWAMIFNSSARDGYFILLASGRRHCRYVELGTAMLRSTAVGRVP